MPGLLVQLGIFGSMFVGFGLIGGSLALALRRGGEVHVTAIDRAPVLARAEAKNAANEHLPLEEAESLKTALERVDAGTTVGTTTTRADLDSGRPELIPGRTATVVLIKDTTFPEGYRILTTYPDTRPAEVDARGSRQP